MNNKLDEFRKDIDMIDQEMKNLFLKRMDIVSQIAEIKKLNNMAIYDSSREQEVITKNSNDIKDELLRKHYINFLISLMDESKLYQKEKNK